MNVAQAASDAIDRMKTRWFGLALAYRDALCKGARKGQLSVAGEIVMKDLARFCRANVSTAVYSPVTGALDPIASAKADGRREVFLRLANFLELDELAAHRLSNPE